MGWRHGRRWSDTLLRPGCELCIHALTWQGRCGEAIGLLLVVALDATADEMRIGFGTHNPALSGC